MNSNYTITFDERVKGWTSFHSFIPDFMIGVNNQFFSFKNGNIFTHHSDNVDRNIYYGEQFPSKISVMFNDSPSDIKELKAVSLEGNSPWETIMKAYISMVDDFTQSSIKAVEFQQKEGFWYTYARRNEDVLQTDSKSVYGIGVVSNISGNTITINGFSDVMVVGDSIANGSNLSVIGTITTITKNGNSTIIELSNTVGLITGDFVIGVKDQRIEGGNLRGYTLRFDLELYQPTKAELYAVNAEVMKSYR